MRFERLEELVNKAAADPKSKEAAIVAGLLELLEPREERVIRLCFGIGRRKLRTLQAIGDDVGVCKSTVARVRDKALRKMQWQINSRSGRARQ
ncbi:sigma factor-like helix-turn-helix DNA-binding protein [Croceicoccus naphthovorans]|uniref:sigma factor-like helix-turn-helix DNA-binding protein n=1 Tax=Croceicoccus naphthovorans TaxID=1348774 RepID=UPI0009E2A330|nr:sigma factor-like helix-turn-helix DNA-binding protein [Croceicoccus naphthovorans]MBB3991660.1 DNA-directed RNA polymerase sigma subunit (sigma70/sigma32) [Croceicoccus naphthovorans]